MKSAASNDEVLKLYLLGQLDEKRQTEVEEQLLLDDQYYQEVLAAEDALADDYVRGKLSSKERSRFEQHFLAAPERAGKLRLSRALNRYLSEQTLRAHATAHNERAGALESLLAFLGLQRPALALALMGAILLLGAGGGWLVLQTIRLRGQVEQARAEQARIEQQNRLDLEQQQARREELSRQLGREQAERRELESQVASLREQQSSGHIGTTGSIVSLSLLPGLLRDTDEMKAVNLVAGARSLRLRLGLDAVLDQNAKAIFSAELRDSEGKQIWKRKVLPGASGKSVTVTVPATTLKEGQYSLVLDVQTDGGTPERAGTYYFRVNK